MVYPGPVWTVNDQGSCSMNLMSLLGRATTCGRFPGKTADMTTVSYHPNSLNLSLHGLQSFGNPGELRRHPAMKIFDRLRDRHPGESVASDCSALGTPLSQGPFRAHGLQIIPIT